MKLIIIAAIARNRVIGKHGKLPWHIPEDMARFKQTTLGQTILMGRKTFESLSKPLPGRRNVVLTSKNIANVNIFPSLDLALQALQNEKQVFVIGGGMVFAETIGLADELRLTIIDEETDGDTFFPPYTELLQERFQLIYEENYKDFSFRDYTRIG